MAGILRLTEEVFFSYEVLKLPHKKCLTTFHNNFIRQNYVWHFKLAILEAVLDMQILKALILFPSLMFVYLIWMPRSPTFIIYLGFNLGMCLISSPDVHMSKFKARSPTFLVHLGFNLGMCLVSSPDVHISYLDV